MSHYQYRHWLMPPKEADIKNFRRLLIDFPGRHRESCHDFAVAVFTHSQSKHFTLEELNILQEQFKAVHLIMYWHGVTADVLKANIVNGFISHQDVLNAILNRWTHVNNPLHLAPRSPEHYCKQAKRILDLLTD